MATPSHEVSHAGLDRTGLDHARLAAARLLAAEVQPFLSVALWALSPTPAPGLGTFAVDRRWRLFVDPVPLAKWSVREVAGVLLHEVGHVVRDHAGRAEQSMVDETTSIAWNLAADAEINDDLRSDRVTLPGSPILPETFHEKPGKAAEFYFWRLTRRRRFPQLPANCGDGCHGQGQLPEDVIGVEIVAGIDAVEAGLLRRRVAEAVLAAGQRPGTDGGGWARWAEATLKPKLDWRRLLAGALRGSIGSVAGCVDYSYRRPSRRRVDRVVLPALLRPIPRVAIIIDTSASMHEALLGAAWSEVRECLRRVGVRREQLCVLATDTAAQRVRGPDLRQVRIALPGGGGTDLCAGFDAAHARRPSVDVIVVLTDGFTPWPTHPPRARTVVAVLGTTQAQLAGFPLPAWAETVWVPQEDLASG